MVFFSRARAQEPSSPSLYFLNHPPYRYEAIACFDGCRCARCLKKTNELYGLYDALDECREYYDIFSNKEDGVLSGDLCKDCFDEICEKHHSIIIEDEVVY